MTIGLAAGRFEWLLGRRVDMGVAEGLGLGVVVGRC